MGRPSQSGAEQTGPPGDALDFQRLFEQSPDVLLVLLPDAPHFTLVAATEARLAVTHTTPAETLGRGSFELFPDNPDDPAATGTRPLRASLERVLATRAPDTMAVQKYDIRRPDGTFEVKYWSPKNLPVLSPDGAVQYILHRVEDVTELVRANEVGEDLRGRTRDMERGVVTRSLELAAAKTPCSMSRRRRLRSPCRPEPLRLGSAPTPGTGGDPPGTPLLPCTHGDGTTAETAATPPRRPRGAGPPTASGARSRCRPPSAAPWPGRCPSAG